MTTDINIINVNGLDYPIKDREARTIAESAVTMFAYYEPGLVASQSYSKVGTLIFWKDALYETITTVAEGNVWAVGVNLSPSIKAGAILSELKDELTANGNRIYMDYKDGKYGYNIDPNRGADTFHPFSGAKEYTATYSCTVGSHGEGYGYSAGAGEIPCSAYNYAEVTAWGNNSPSGQGYVTLSIAKSGVVDLTDIDTITYSLQAYSNVQAGGNRAYFTIHMWV